MSLFMNTNLFLSTHVNRIDGKGRVSFPASFRQAITVGASGGVAIFKSLTHPAIEGVTIERLQQMSAALESMPAFGQEREDFELGIFATAQELQIEKEGRCSLPKSLLEEIGVQYITGAEVAFVGRGHSFQIWEPAALERRKAEAAKSLKARPTPFPILPASNQGGGAS